MFGGTFDPVHTGHTAIARHVLESGRAGRLLFVPAPNPPFKNTASILPYADRRAMLELALPAVPGAEISDIECRRTEKSYTIDTLAALENEYPGARLVLLIGSDSLAHLHEWYRAEELPRRAEILTYPRPGADVTVDFLAAHWPEKTAAELAAGILADLPVSSVSSTEIRNFFARGKNPPDGMLDRAVADYIRRRHLYGSGKRVKMNSTGKNQ